MPGRGGALSMSGGPQSCGLRLPKLRAYPWPSLHLCPLVVLSLCPVSRGLHPSLFGSLSLSFWVSVLPCLWSLSPSPCPFLLCVHSSFGSLTARIRQQFIVWSRVRGAFEPRTWWCQCWGGQVALSSRPGCRTCCDAGWSGLPRAQVIREAGCVSRAGPLPPPRLRILPTSSFCVTVDVTFCFPPCLYVSFCVQGPGSSLGACTQASAGMLVWLCGTTRRPAQGAPTWWPWEWPPGVWFEIETPSPTPRYSPGS